MSISDKITDKIASKLSGKEIVTVKTSREDIIKLTETVINEALTENDYNEIKKVFKGRIFPNSRAYNTENGKYRIFTYYTATLASRSLLNEVWILDIDTGSAYSYKAIFARKYKKAVKKILANHK